MVRRDFRSPPCPREVDPWRQSFSSLDRAGRRLSTKQTGEPRRRPAGSGHVCLGRLRHARLRDDRRRHPRRRPRHRFGLALGAGSLFQRSPRRRAGSGSRSWCGGERALTRSASRLKLRTRPTARESGRSRRTQQQYRTVPDSSLNPIVVSRGSARTAPDRITRNVPRNHPRTLFGAEALCVADRARPLLLHSGARVGVLGTTSAESIGSELTGRGPRCARYRA
jgi:hypothetical protein